LNVWGSPERPRFRNAEGDTTMNKMTHTKKSFLQDTRGANLVEYIILVGVVALIALAGFRLFGQKVDAKIQEQSGKVGGI
jgi:Flp pilus assembly pilin Flp